MFRPRQPHDDDAPPDFDDPEAFADDPSLPGSPIAVPISMVTRPASISTTGYGCAVAYSRRAPVQAPIWITAPWPSENSPTRPTRTPRPSATTA